MMQKAAALASYASLMALSSNAADVPSMPPLHQFTEILARTKLQL